MKKNAIFVRFRAIFPLRGTVPGNVTESVTRGSDLTPFPLQSDRPKQFKKIKRLNM